VIGGNPTFGVQEPPKSLRPNQFVLPKWDLSPVEMFPNPEENKRPERPLSQKVEMVSVSFIVSVISCVFNTLIVTKIVPM